MPLHDHFNPPLSRQRHWDSFHGAWAEAMARHLNEELLPARFFAEARIKIGTQMKIDVASFQEGDNYARSADSDGGVAVWSPPQPRITTIVDFGDLDLIEVHVRRDDEGPRSVAAVELVSPANKDHPSNRHWFATKCASYLQDNLGLVLIDVVTDRHGNLHRELLQFLNVGADNPWAERDLYATAYRTRSQAKQPHLDIWAEPLELGRDLPTLPLWIEPDLALPLDLEQTYQMACAARRIS